MDKRISQDVDILSQRYKKIITLEPLNDITIRINLSSRSAKCSLEEEEMHDMWISGYHLFII